MKTEEIIGALESLSADDASTVFKSMFSGRTKQFQRLIDAYAGKVVSGTERYFQGEVEKLQEGVSEEIYSRLGALEKSFETRKRQLELAYHAKSRALEAGIDAALLVGFSFTDERAVDRKVLELAKALAQKERKAVNERLASSFKPASGGEIEHGAPTTDQRSFKEIQDSVSAQRSTGGGK